MIELWTFPLGVSIGYGLVVLFDEPTKEGTGFFFGVWIMYFIAYFLR